MSEPFNLNRLNVTWHRTIEDDNNAYVIEEGVGMRTKFGPMPEGMMAPFIDERKQFYSSFIKAKLEHYAALTPAKVDEAG